MLRGRPPIKKDSNFILERVRKMRSGCWHWSGSIRPDGYGKTGDRGRQYLAHRLSYCISTGMDMKSDLLVLHKCNNKKCVNPEHLYAGTQAQNVQDALRAGVKFGAKDKTGLKNPNSKLTLDEAKQIAKELGRGKTVANLAKQFGISVKPIYSIRTKTHWSTK